MFHLDDFKRRMIVMGIAIVLILMGAVQGIFKIKMNQEVLNQVSFVLMMIAAAVLFSGRNAAKTNETKNPETSLAEETPHDGTPGEIESQTIAPEITDKKE